MDFENVERVQSSLLVAMSRFLTEIGTYTLSFCKLSGGAKLNTFSSEKKIKSTSADEKFRNSCFDQVKRGRRSAAVSCCVQRFFRHFSWRSLWIIHITEVWEIPVALLIWWEVWCVCGASSWLSTNSLTALTLLSVWTVRGCPLPGRRSIVPVFFSLSRKLLTVDTFHPLLGNSLISFLAPKPSTC